jgi:hypothetical protein
MTMLTTPRSSIGIAALVVALGISCWLQTSEAMWRSLWPSVAALSIVLLSRSAFVGLLSGAVCGAVLLSGGSVVGLLEQLVLQQFWPIFGSSWKLSAILFTLILGGFVALVEAGGGLQGLVQRLLGSGRAPHKRMQFTVFGFGRVDLIFDRHVLGDDGGADAIGDTGDLLAYRRHG